MNAKTKPAAASAMLDAANSLAILDDAETGTFMVNLDDIEIVDQVREVFETEDQTLADLGDSMEKNGQLQAVVICVNPNPASGKPWRLVAGERRCRAAKLKGWMQIEAKNKGELDEDDVDNMQTAENIHRLGLSLIEEAKQVEKVVKKLGSVEAAAKYFNKSMSWISKTRGLLNLPEHTQSLIDKGITANRETLNAVKGIEKRDPEKAKEVVAKLEANKAKPAAERQNSRNIAEKEAVQVKKADAKAKVAKEVEKTAKPTVKEPKWLAEQRERDSKLSGSKTDPNEPKPRGQTLPPDNHELPGIPTTGKKPVKTTSVGRFDSFKEEDEKYFDKAVRYIDKQYFDETSLVKDAVADIRADGNCASFIENELVKAHNSGGKVSKEQFGFTLRRNLKEETFAAKGIRAFFMHAFCEGFAGLELDIELQNYE
jgi:ParB/RepB/Spo0J family partition protein